MSVVYEGRKYNIQRGELKLNSSFIKDISKIKGLENLTNLVSLDLKFNEITEVKGLDKLTNLKWLNLERNKITEIKGLENLINLQYLNLANNKITEIKGLENLINLETLRLSENSIKIIKGLENLINLEKLWLKHTPVEKWIIKNFDVFYYREPQRLVEYCRKKAEEVRIVTDKKRREQREREIQLREIREKEEEERLNKEAIDKIKKIVKVSDRIKIEMMRKILKMDEDSFHDKILDWATEFDFRIDGDYLVIKQETVNKFIDALDQ